MKRKIRACGWRYQLQSNVSAVALYNHTVEFFCKNSKIFLLYTHTHTHTNIHLLTHSLTIIFYHAIHNHKTLYCLFSDFCLGLLYSNFWSQFERKLDFVSSIIYQTLFPFTTRILIIAGSLSKRREPFLR